MAEFSIFYICIIYRAKLNGKMQIEVNSCKLFTFFKHINGIIY